MHTTSFKLPRLARALPVLALVLAACGGPGAADATSAENPLVGKPAPEVTAEKITGEGPASLKEASGKVVVLDFWGTFCGPCEKSFPKYQQMLDQFGSDVTVIAVSEDEPEDKDKIPEFAAKTSVKFPLLWDKDKSVVKQYAPPTMPTSFIIDKNGVVRHVHVGYHDGDEAQIAEEIKALLQ